MDNETNAHVLWISYCGMPWNRILQRSSDNQDRFLNEKNFY